MDDPTKEDPSRRDFAAMSAAVGVSPIAAAAKAQARVAETGVEIKTPDGTADGYLYVPQGASGRLPGVVMYTNILGVRPAAREMAQRLAGEGYVVLLPNHFYRAGRAPFNPIPNLAVPAEREKAVQLASAIKPDMVERDARANLAFLQGRPEVDAARLGAVGYCMTGSYAMRVAAAAPDRVRAVASFHGGNLITPGPDSAHLLIPRIRARQYYGHATNDASMTAAQIAQFEADLKAAGGRYVSETYPAAHGWSIKDGPVYDEAQAERAWRNLTGMLKESLAA